MLINYDLKTIEKISDYEYKFTLKLRIVSPIFVDKEEEQSFIYKKNLFGHKVYEVKILDEEINNYMETYKSIDKNYAYKIDENEQEIYLKALLLDELSKKIYTSDFFNDYVFFKKMATIEPIQGKALII